jgi:hypothetical protein
MAALFPFHKIGMTGILSGKHPARLRFLNNDAGFVISRLAGKTHIVTRLKGTELLARSAATRLLNAI